MIDWVKMRTDLYRHPKVLRMATHLLEHDSLKESIGDQFDDTHFVVPRHVMRHATVGALVTVWGVTRHIGKRDGDDLVLSGVTLDTIDELADMPGIGEAMCSVDWAIADNSGAVIFPKFFADNNVDPAEKLRESSRQRSKRYRDKRKTVTSPSRDTGRDANVTVTGRVEESRVEESREVEAKPSPASGDADDTDTAKPPTSPYTQAFEAWWLVYPRKKDKRAAFAPWTRACTRVGTEHGLDRDAAEAYLLEAVQAFAPSELGQAGQFCPYGATWLNAGSYDDDRAEWDRDRNGESAKPKKQQEPTQEDLDNWSPHGNYE